MPNLSPVEDPKYPIYLPDEIEASMPTEEQQLPELPVPAAPDDISSLSEGVTFGDTGHLTETLGENPDSENAKALASAAQTLTDLQEQMIEASASTPPQIGVEKPKIPRYDQAILDIEDAIRSGNSPTINDDYQKRALAHLDGTGRLRAAAEEAVKNGADPDTVAKYIERAQEKASVNFGYQREVPADRGRGGADRGVRHRIGGEEVATEQTLGQTPDIANVDEKVSGRQ